ncbi:HAMP domain-containing sensor histidine kinase [Spirulina sp. 06S082]|uniref:sensor histidine kinase n=1 Tax=Spirulina sp. 06S082 TaxID=3110248 RepID=UPI002B1FE1C1|nr:HAMP domain-containing sensor histidine kinase [Spirulina sp. 06S082]MEA5467638.1 HAMP domain-containing sensor histidine kinase [Spirulina sp. 06S082]
MTSLISDRQNAKLSLMSPSSDLSSVCQTQLEYIASSLSCITTWIVYREQKGDERKSFRFVLKKSETEQTILPEGENRELLSYLEGENWLDRNFPELQWTQWQLVAHPILQLIAIESNFIALNSENSQEKNYIYIYCFDGQEKPDEYFLLWKEQPLSESEYHYLQQQINFLENYMALMQTVTQQREEIDFLEQLIQRGKHQLRKPLALIGLYAENLCLGLAKGKYQEQAQGIRDSVSELSHNLKRLLNSDREMRIYPALYDLRKILQETLTLLQPQVEEKNIKVIYPDQGIILAIDRWQLKQVFEVLLCNAISFSPEHEKLFCNWQILADEVLIEICDRGRGLSPEDRENAFSPFYSRRIGGTGLGLAIAKDIIDRHQGKIWAENMPEGGARFCFTLPRQGSQSAIGILGEFCL